MPLVAYSKLPTFQRLLSEHHDVLTLDKAKHQYIRELHIGLLNMMPDASLKATERQFMRLVGDCNQIVQFYVHVFTLPSIKRSTETQNYIDEHYETFEHIKAQGLDALIISGANPEKKTLDEEDFWQELTEVFDWAKQNVTSTLCACLATHAILQYQYDIAREPLANKKWGVYMHRVTSVSHPLTRHMNTKFDVPHSRNNQMSKEQLDKVGVKVLVESEQAGVHLAVSPDGIRTVFFQGHPEYDHLSLLKEYKREIDRWFNNLRPDYPPFPHHYFEPIVEQRLQAIKKAYMQAKTNNQLAPDWPEAWLLNNIDNTWRDTALTTFNNWLGVVYQLTNKNRKLPFMDNVDPDNPLAAL